MVLGSFAPALGRKISSGPSLTRSAAVGAALAAATRPAVSPRLVPAPSSRPAAGVVSMSKAAKPLPIGVAYKPLRPVAAFGGGGSAPAPAPVAPVVIPPAAPELAPVDFAAAAGGGAAAALEQASRDFEAAPAPEPAAAVTASLDMPYPMWIAIGVGALALVGGGVYLATRKKKRAAA